jgi:hypothetical protein
MRLGVLGSDAGIEQVVAAARRRGDSIVAVAATPLGDWGSLLDPAACDAVLVGADGWDQSRAEAVRTLVQAGRPLLLSHPLELSMVWAFELEMIRRDSGAVLLPLLPDRLHPFVERLRQSILVGLAGVHPPGPPESLAFERRMRDRSRQAVLTQLARDADLVRALAGEPDRLSTLSGPDQQAVWNSLAVGFSGPGRIPVRWQVAPGDVPGLTIRLQSTRGTTTLDIPDSPTAPWTWNDGCSESAAFDRGDAILDVLDRSVGSPGTSQPPRAATWSDAGRAIELAETVPRSLTKGRAIDLHHEEFSELGTFRGTMASLGCGLVLTALVVLVSATLVAGIAHEIDWQLGKTVANAWPLIVLGVLATFLALQLLPLFVGGSASAPRPGAGPGEHE